MAFDPAVLALYVVTSATVSRDRGHVEIARAAIAGGATAIQLRAPELDDEALLPVAREIVALGRAGGVLTIVNDRVGVAMEADADGVHLGQEDAFGDAARRVGPRRVLGISVGTPLEARGAEAAGAHYLGVTVWSTATKPEARPVGLDGVRAIARATRLPVVGIGGIDASNAADVLAAGARGVAVVSAVAAADDMVAAARGLRDAIAGADAAARGGAR
ncbi:MAG TPA: thiamine phosphate synthase [Actinomycetota bacterium]|jgi:thiamine-phosphate pyrophosphorylase